MLTLIVLFGRPSESFATRLCRADISVGGKVVLECGGGDNGSPDADEVWETLKTRHFSPSEHFTALQIPADAQEFTIRSNPPEGGVAIVVDVPYGGRSETRSLRIIRAPSDTDGPAWMIDPKEVDEMYDWRTITRDQAAYLKHPEKIAIAEHLAAIKFERAAISYTPLVAGVFIGVAFTSVIAWLRRPKAQRRVEIA
jgi:hypothetical protein